MANSNKNSRLVEIDALRGLAALAVVLFHYTSRFHELFEVSSLPTFSFPYGHYGVNLFFIISGFVIFMTLEKTSRPMDFVVSRFSRLFPAYWVAIILTFSITHALGLPGKLVDLGAALGNLFMIQGIFHIPHVDGVYWTLEVELLFYCGMFFLYRIQRLDLIHWALLGLLALRVIYFALAQGFGIELSWTISRLLILPYIPWFALGIAIYLVTSHRHPGEWRWPAQTAALAVVTLAIVDSLSVALLAVGLGAAVFLAASGRAPLLRHRVLVWLGAISYPLYLVHENIGWSLQLRLAGLGISADVAVLIALLCSLTMAKAMTRWIELPAKDWIRKSYHSDLVVRRMYS